MKRLLMLSLLLSVVGLQAILPGDYPGSPRHKLSNVVVSKQSLLDAVMSGNVDKVRAAAANASPAELNQALVTAKSTEIRSVLLDYDAIY